MKPLPVLANIEHVVWIQTAFLGDLILTSGAMQLLQAHLLRTRTQSQAPGLKQWLVTNPTGAQLFANDPLLSGVFSLDKAKGSFWKQARSIKKQLKQKGLRANNTLIVQPHRSTRSSLLSLNLAYPWLTYTESSLAFLASHTVARVAALHECSRIALLLEPLGVAREEIVACKPALPSFEQGLSSSSKHFNELHQFDKPKKTLVALAPGSVWGTKRWPQTSFSALITKLALQPDLDFILLGGAGEIELAATISQTCKSLVDRGRLKNLVGKTTLAELCWLFPKLSLVVSNDSSPVHFASAYKVPTIALFGATTPALGFGPLAPNSRSLGVEGLDCRPCSDHGPQTCPLKHFRCMHELSPERVHKHCLDALGLGASSFSEAASKNL